MITDKISNKELYSGIHNGFKEAFEFLEKVTNENIPVGKYEIDKDNVYAIVQEYETKEPDKWERHKKYIDVQYIVSGNEIIGWENISVLPSMPEYFADKDCSLFNFEGGSNIIMKPGYFCVLFPDDMHRPGTKYKKIEKIKKVIVKIAVDY